MWLRSTLASIWTIAQFRIELWLDEGDWLCYMWRLRFKHTRGNKHDHFVFGFGNVSRVSLLTVHEYIKAHMRTKLDQRRSINAYGWTFVQME